MPVRGIRPHFHVQSVAHFRTVALPCLDSGRKALHLWVVEQQALLKARGTKAELRVPCSLSPLTKKSGAMLGGGLTSARNGPWTYAQCPARPRRAQFFLLVPDMRASGVLRLGETMFSLCGALAICGMGVERKGLAESIPPVHAVMPIPNICPTAAYTGRQRQPKPPSSAKFGSISKNIRLKC